APETVPTVTLTATIRPKRARAHARVEFTYWNPDVLDHVPYRENPRPQGPPLDKRTEFVVTSGTRNLRVTATGYEPFPPLELLVFEDQRFPIDLVERQNVPVPRGGETGLDVRSADRLARISVCAGGGTRLESAYEFLSLRRLAPGRYRVGVELTETERVEQLVEIRTGKIESLTLNVTPATPMPTEPVMRALVAAGIHYDRERGIQVFADHAWVTAIR